jgi:hypothetical protein
MSRENEHIDDLYDSLRRRSEEWDAGDAPDFGDLLGDSLSAESVWSRLDKQLTAEETAVDEQLRGSFAAWSPQPHDEVWEKIDASLSMETVWERLSATLAGPERSYTWIKMAAACLIALLAGNRINDGFNGSDQLRESDSYELAIAGDTHTFSETGGEASSDMSGSENIEASPRGAQSLQPRRDRNNVASAQNNDTDNRRGTGKPEAADNDLTAVQPENTTASDTAERSADAIAEAVVPEIGDPSLPYLRWSNDASLADLAIMPRGRGISDHWTLQLGTQIAVMRETKREQLTSFKPKPGLAADIAYRKHFGNLQLIGAFGISQYTQAAGKYTNGRYYNADQKVNTMQLSASLGYNLGRTTFYSGIVISNMFLALEEKGNTITQIYRFREIEPGIAVGADYRILDWGAANRPVSLGVQYQYLPGNSVGESTFEKIHGLRLQAKFGF